MIRVGGDGQIQALLLEDFSVGDVLHVKGSPGYQWGRLRIRTRMGNTPENETCQVSSNLPWAHCSTWCLTKFIHKLILGDPWWRSSSIPTQRGGGFTEHRSTVENLNIIHIYEAGDFETLGKPCPGCHPLGLGKAYDPMDRGKWRVAEDWGGKWDG